MKKSLQEKVAHIIDTCEFINENGNDIWNNRFYRSENGFLFNIQTKNRKLFDVISYGR